MSILKKVLDCGSFEDLKNYVESEELLTLKLSNSEMELVKGGKSTPILGDIIKNARKPGPYNTF
jgi:hypothetical protein